MAPSAHLEAPSGHLEASSGHLEASSGNLEAPSGHPEAPSGHPEALSGQPEAQSDLIKRLLRCLKSKASKEAILLEQSCQKLEKKKKCQLDEKNNSETIVKSAHFEMGHKKSCIFENGASEMAYLLSGAFRKG